MNDEYVTPREAARLADKDRQTIYRWFREGKLTRYKKGSVHGRRGRTLVSVRELNGLLEIRPESEAC